MPRTPLRTTGELRQFLSEVMVDLREGRIEPSKAARIAQLAGQINNSLLAEIATARQHIMQGDSAPDVGTTPLFPVTNDAQARAEAVIIEAEPVRPSEFAEVAPHIQAIEKANGAGAELARAHEAMRAAKRAVPAPRF